MAQPSSTAVLAHLCSRMTKTAGHEKVAARLALMQDKNTAKLAAILAGKRARNG